MKKVIPQIERKCKVAPFSMFHAKTWVGFYLKTGKRFYFQEVSFQGRQTVVETFQVKVVTKDFQNSSLFEKSGYFYPAIAEILNICQLNIFSENFVSFSEPLIYKELIWCTNFSNIRIHNFRSAGVLLENVFPGEYPYRGIVEDFHRLKEVFFLNEADLKRSYWNWSLIDLRTYQTDYNYFHNILRLFVVLPNFPFTTNETIRDYFMVYTSYLSNWRTT